jgi:hypothetical protein
MKTTIRKEDLVLHKNSSQQSSQEDAETEMNPILGLKVSGGSKEKVIAKSPRRASPLSIEVGL